MFPFKKKTAPCAAPCPNEQVNRKLDETHARLEETVRDMSRRLEEKQRRPRLSVVK